jgi:hypothetical protein
MLGLIIAAFVFVLKLFLGAGLIFGCARGLITREWMYDEESTRYMTWTQWVGVGVGLWLIANAFGYFQIPYVPFV